MDFITCRRQPGSPEFPRLWRDVVLGGRFFGFWIAVQHRVEDIEDRAGKNHSDDRLPQVVATHADADRDCDHYRRWECVLDRVFQLFPYIDLREARRASS